MRSRSSCRALPTQSLRDGLLADARARERLSGGPLTVDGRLVLIADRKDLTLVKRFVTKIGGDFDAATIRTGHREFVGWPCAHPHGNGACDAARLTSDPPPAARACLPR